MYYDSEYFDICNKTIFYVPIFKKISIKIYDMFGTCLLFPRDQTHMLKPQGYNYLVLTRISSYSTHVLMIFVFKMTMNIKRDGLLNSVGPRTDQSEKNLLFSSIMFAS